MERTTAHSERKVGASRTTGKVDDRTKIVEKLRSADNLPSLPAVALEILRLTKDENVEIDDLAGVIESDPALAGKLLRLVNSAFFGIRREIGSMRLAVSLLGLRTVKILALGFSLVDTIRGPKESKFDYRRYWQRSVTSAVAGRLISETVVPCFTEEAFVAGLLSDIGMFAAWRCLPEIYEPVIDSWNSGQESIYQVEIRLIGLSHATLGKELLSHWGLPDCICNAVGAHHGENIQSVPGDSQKLTQVTCSAASIAELFCQEVPSTRLDAVIAQCQQLTSIAAGDLERILNGVNRHVHEAASMLGVEMGETVDYGQIQHEAAVRVAQLSMRMETELIEYARKETATQQETAQLIEERKIILEQVSTDALTGIANRREFERELKAGINRAARFNTHIALILLDVDHFKDINDTHGHQVGDAVLRTIAQLVRDNVRTLDRVARYGGEEFAVIIPQLGPQDSMLLAERIRQAVAATTCSVHGGEFTVTVSIGVAVWKGDRTQIAPEKLIEAADKALYHAKKTGRNRTAYTSLLPSAACLTRQSSHVSLFPPKEIKDDE